MNETRSTCCYCGVGCGVIIQSEGAAIVGVRGDPDHPANRGRLCTKGTTLHLSTGTAGRVLHPELRERAPGAGGGARRRVGWDEALEHAASRFASIIREHGPDAVAFYISGQLLTEDYYVFNKLARALVGTNNIDTNSRLCMSSAVSGYKATLGADAPPACYDDIDHADCFFIAGSNAAIAHPVLYRRIEDARRRRPELKLIVVDPRVTETARDADLHLAILPGTDVALYNGMLHLLLWDGRCDLGFIGRHTAGFDDLKQAVHEYTPSAVAQICGISESDLARAAHWFGASRATLSLYCQGLNQSANGTQNNAALINLHLATGQIGRAGAGPFSLTGQPNAMGGREVGGLANQLCAHRELSDPAHRAEVAALWGVTDVPSRPGKTAVELFDALRSGEVKAVWIACTNPAQSMPDAGRACEALKKAAFVVLQEAFHDTDTVPFADLLLPAATWGEKEGVVTNSERRISRVRRALPPPGEARCDWEIARDFAVALGRALGREDAPHLFGFRCAEDVFDEHRATTRGRDLDIGGLSYPVLERDGPQQWPYPEGATTGRARLYEDGIFPTPDGRARFVPATHRPSAEKTDARHPLHLNTGRLRDQWHGMSRTGRVARLYSLAEEPQMQMNARDMERRGLVEGDIVRVRSRRGATVLPVAASDTLRQGQSFIAMHWGARSMNSAGANALTLPAVDPVSRQPELKHAAVQVEKLVLPWRLVAMRRVDTTTPAAADLKNALVPLLASFDYASVSLYGREQPVVLLRAAGRGAAAPELIEALDETLRFEAPDLRYSDARRGISKRIMLRDGRIAAARLTGETAARDWLRELMARGEPAESFRQWMLAPFAAPPDQRAARGRVVCTCEDVSENEISAVVMAGADLATLQSELRCGTGCGSCTPELKRLLERHSRRAA